eukprot:1722377-Rhodomonas_salina.1
MFCTAPRSVVLTSAMLLRICYGVSSTALRYDSMLCAVLTSAMQLRFRGTNLGYAAMRQASRSAFSSSSPSLACRSDALDPRP